MHDEYYNLLNEYRNYANYIIKDFHNDSCICYVFVSSQGIYSKPWDIEGLKNVFHSNRFEWRNISENKKIIAKAKKYIFIRDLGKELYQRGINHNIDTIEKIITFVRKQTEGLTVYLVGSSSGGYLSFILSQLRNVKRVYSFGGLVYIGNKSTYLEIENNQYVNREFVSAEKYISGHCQIIHSFGTLNEEDSFNFGILKSHFSNQCIFLPFNSDKHAPRPKAKDLIKLLCYNDFEIDLLKKEMKRHSEITQFYYSFITNKLALMSFFKRKKS